MVCTFQTSVTTSNLLHSVTDDKSAPILKGAFIVWRSEYVTLTLTWTIQVKGRQAAQVQPRPILLQPALPITNHIRGTG